MEEAAAAAIADEDAEMVVRPVVVLLVVVLLVAALPVAALPVSALPVVVVVIVGRSVAAVVVVVVAAAAATFEVAEMDEVLAGVVDAVAGAEVSPVGARHSQMPR